MGHVIINQKLKNMMEVAWTPTEIFHYIISKAQLGFDYQYAGYKEHDQIYPIIYEDNVINKAIELYWDNEISYDFKVKEITCNNCLGFTKTVEDMLTHNSECGKIKNTA